MADTLPLASRSVALATSFFGPRNLPGIERVLQTDGILAIVTPTREHLTEMIDPLRMLHVDQRKAERLATRLSAFNRTAAERITYRATVTRDQARALVQMGPSALHVTPADPGARLELLPTELSVTVSVILSVYANSSKRRRAIYSRVGVRRPLNDPLKNVPPFRARLEQFARVVPVKNPPAASAWSLLVLWSTEDDLEEITELR